MGRKPKVVQQQTSYQQQRQQQYSDTDESSSETNQQSQVESSILVAPDDVVKQEPLQSQTIDLNADMENQERLMKEKQDKLLEQLENQLSRASSTGGQQPPMHQARVTSEYNVYGHDSEFVPAVEEDEPSQVLDVAPTRGRGRGRGRGRPPANVSSQISAVMPTQRTRGRGRGSSGFANAYARAPSAFDSQFGVINAEVNYGSDTSSSDEADNPKVVVKNEDPPKQSLKDFIKKKYHPIGYPDNIVRQARGDFPEFDASKVKHECAILSQMKQKRLPKTIDKLKRRYLKSLGSLTPEQWQFVTQDMCQIAWDPQLTFAQHKFKEEWLTQRANKFKLEGIRTWARPLYEHYSDVLDVKRRKAVAFEYGEAQDRYNDEIQDFLEFDEYNFD